MSGLPSWSLRGIKGQLPFLFLAGSLPARSTLPTLVSHWLPLVLALPSVKAFLCVHLPSGLSHHQNGPGWSPPGGAVEMPLSAWVNLRASYFIHGLFCARLLILCLHGAFEGSKKRKVTTQRMNCTDHWRLWWQVLRERS